MGDKTYIKHAAQAGSRRVLSRERTDYGSGGERLLRRDGPDAADRARELREAEHALIDAVPEEDSPFAVGPHPASPKWHPEWVKARAAYARTGTPRDLDAMLRYVTHANPPLARDLVPATRPAQPSWVARASARVLTLAEAQAYLACVLLAAVGEPGPSAVAGVLAVVLMLIAHRVRKRAA